ncbi:hypothetical protein [Pseudomonas ogarae]|uniref:hypothetical protein n=1 Tax=Pseudomonas ogarae (strain DSM 112162 / CECT 30235 / F113) TaxID=1114970 RepID=UPI0011D282D9|nr:hypothetical protein [Pseudomonas ogarae]
MVVDLLTVMNSTTPQTLVVLAAYGLRQIASPPEPTSRDSGQFRPPGEFNAACPAPSSTGGAFLADEQRGTRP